MTLFYANGDINNAKFQSNLVMGAGPLDPFESRHMMPSTESPQGLGIRFDRRFDLTEEIVCADLDGNGRTDTVFVANTQNRDYLWRYRPSITLPEASQ